MLKTFQQSGSPSSVYSPSLPVQDRHNKLLQVLAASRIEVFVRESTQGSGICNSTVLPDYNGVPGSIVIPQVFRCPYVLQRKKCYANVLWSGTRLLGLSGQK